VRFIEPTTTRALQVDYVLDIIARGEYARRLTRCALESCGRFFFQEFGKKRPYSYCPDTDHREQAHKLSNPKRAADTRARKKAQELLMHEHRISRRDAPELVKGFKNSSAEEIVRQVLAKRGHK
jgi:hypothetical protein